MRSNAARCGGETDSCCGITLSAPGGSLTPCGNQTRTSALARLSPHLLLASANHGPTFGSTHYKIDGDFLMTAKDAS